ncbi:MAG: NADAR family protein [Archangiaceae bacterium]|nr:NADAR family protein [Archangiaceae bacterium]
MLPLTLEALRASSQSFTFRPFYGHTARADGRVSDACFSQWSPCRFVVDGGEYVNAEQFMMASKARLFGDREMLTRILAEGSPAKVKALGRQVRHFDAAVWERHRFDAVAFGSHAKFSQNEDLKAHLLSTGQSILVEAAPRDRIWGIGLGRENPLVNEPHRWRGQNLLGFALVHARAVLREELPAIVGGPWRRMVDE